MTQKISIPETDLLLQPGQTSRHVRDWGCHAEGLHQTQQLLLVDTLCNKE